MRFSNPEEIGSYVYSLVDPNNKEIFYIGKGKENRVFQHAEDAIDSEHQSSDKIERIRTIHKNKQDVLIYIVRHNLTEEEAFILESSLIDLMELIGKPLTNLQGGYNSSLYGLMSADEIERRYTLEKLSSLPKGFICININKTYKRGADAQAIYNATKEAWVINKNKLNEITHVLSEYRGRVVGVFTNLKWYPIEIRGKIRFGFNGDFANNIQDEYLNKLVPPRRKGAIAPVRHNFNWD